MRVRRKITIHGLDADWSSAQRHSMKGPACTPDANPLMAAGFNNVAEMIRSEVGQVMAVV
jgi:hypothetical protein